MLGGGGRGNGLPRNSCPPECMTRLKQHAAHIHQRAPIPLSYRIVDDTKLLGLLVTPPRRVGLAVNEEVVEVGLKVLVVVVVVVVGLKVLERLLAGPPPVIIGFLTKDEEEEFIIPPLLVVVLMFLLREPKGARFTNTEEALPNVAPLAEDETEEEAPPKEGRGTTPAAPIPIPIPEVAEAEEEVTLETDGRRTFGTGFGRNLGAANDDDDDDTAEDMDKRETPTLLLLLPTATL